MIFKGQLMLITPHNPFLGSLSIATRVAIPQRMLHVILVFLADILRYLSDKIP